MLKIIIITTGFLLSLNTTFAIGPDKTFSDYENEFQRMVENLKDIEKNRDEWYKKFKPEIDKRDLELDELIKKRDEFKKKIKASAQEVKKLSKAGKKGTQEFKDKVKEFRAKVKKIEEMDSRIESKEKILDQLMNPLIAVDEKIKKRNIELNEAKQMLKNLKVKVANKNCDVASDEKSANCDGKRYVRDEKTVGENTTKDITLLDGDISRIIQKARKREDYKSKVDKSESKSTGKKVKDVD